MKYILNGPFNELEKVTQLIKLYKEGVSLIELAYYFDCPTNTINNTLRFHNIPRRIRVGNVRVYVEPPARKKDKYAYLLEEPVNSGKSYRVLCKEKGIKVVKEWGGCTRGLKKRTTG